MLQDCYLTRQSCGVLFVLICLACGLFVTVVAEEEGEPQGLHRCERCFGFDDQLRGLVGCLGGKGTLISFVYGHLMATFASAV